MNLEADFISTEPKMLSWRYENITSELIILAFFQCFLETQSQKGMTVAKRKTTFISCVSRRAGMCILMMNLTGCDPTGIVKIIVQATEFDLARVEMCPLK